MKVQDLMTTDLVVAHPDTSLQDVARLLVEHRISVVPVVDDEKRLLGVVGANDLFPSKRTFTFSGATVASFLHELVDDPPQLLELYGEARARAAADVMNRVAVCVGPDDNLEQTVSLMLHRDLTWLPVVKEGMLVGVLTRADLLRLLARTA